VEECRFNGYVAFAVRLQSPKNVEVFNSNLFRNSKHAVMKATSIVSYFVIKQDRLCGQE